MTDSIILSREHHVATLTFNRPDKLNAFDHSMMDYFEALCQEINDDHDIRVVLLRGKGEMFTTGTDLYELNRCLDAYSSEALSTIRQFNACILLLKEMEKLVIAEVHGMVMGIGMSLLLAADLVIASENTKFSLGYNRIALPPVGACSYLLPRAVGIKKAMELLTMSEVFDTKAAQALNLINWIVPQQELEAKTQQVIDYIIHGPLVAFVQTKQLLNSSMQNKFAVQLEFEAEACGKCIDTKDFKIAVSAFVNKQIPEFEGR